MPAIFGGFSFSKVNYSMFMSSHLIGFGPPPLLRIVRQRAADDCVVASLATILGETYEAAADLLGVEINSDSSAKLDGWGLAAVEVAWALLTKRGIETVHLIARDCSQASYPPNMTRSTLLPWRYEIESFANGRLAIMSKITAPKIEAPRFICSHAVVWDGCNYLDCATSERLAAGRFPLIEALIFPQFGVTR